MKEVKLLQKTTVEGTLGPGESRVLNIEQYRRDHITIMNNRGKIINAVVTLEQELAGMLELLLSSKLYDSVEFGKNIWSKRNVDLKLKLDVLDAFRKSNHKYIERDKEDWKKFRSFLQEAMEIRNKFAHGDVRFINECPFLIFLNDKGKEKQQELEDSYWEYVEKTINLSTDLSQTLKKKLEDYVEESMSSEKNSA